MFGYAGGGGGSRASLGFRALGQRISERAGHGRRLDNGQRKGVEMMGFRNRGHLTRFQSLGAEMSIVAVEL